MELCVNVGDFGAKGDGTDATQGIQEAIDFVASAAGGTVCVPPGLYIISKAIDLKDKVHLRGSGHNVTTLKLKDNVRLTAAEYQAFAGSLLRIFGKKGVTASALRMDGNKDNNEWLGCKPGFQGNYQQGIVIQSDPPFSNDAQFFSENCLVEDCWIENCITDGIYVERARHIIIRNCVTRNNGIVLPSPTPIYQQCDPAFLVYKCNFVPFEPWGIILADYTEHCILENCSAFGNPHGGIECWSHESRYHQIRYCRADSIYINPNPVSNAPAQPVHHSIIGCLVDNRRVLSHRKNGPDVCIGFYSASQVTIRDCYCITAYVAGISGGGPEPQDYNKGIVITNNRVELGDPILPVNLPLSCPHDPPYAGINVAYLADAIISGNTVTGEFTAAAIRMVNCRQVAVTGNSATGIGNYWGGQVANPTAGIHLLEGCQELSVTGNSVRGFKIGIDEGASHDNTLLGNVLRNNEQPIVAGVKSFYTGNMI